MMVCGVMTLGNLIHALLPHWRSGIMAGILLFIIIDRLYTFRQLKSLTPLSSEWAMAIGAQWVLIILLTRFLLSYANGLDSLRRDLSLLARGYIAELFTPEFVVSVLLAFLVWFLCGRFLYVLDDIGLEQTIASDPESSLVRSEVLPAHQRLVILFFSIGIGLVLLSALARIDYSNTFANTDGLPTLKFIRFSGAEAGALLYFVFGLALLSLSRLMSLQTQWNQLRIRVTSEDLYRQWGRYSVLFLVILAVIVSLLPAGDSLGFFSLLGSLFNFLVSILFFIGQLMISLFMLLISLPFLLFNQSLPALQPAPPPPLPVMPPAPVSQPASNAAWTLIRSFLLWGALVVIIFFALIRFFRQHGGLGAALRASRITNWLMLAWQWLYRQADKTRLELSRAVGDGWQHIVSRLEGKRILSPRLFRLRSLDSRRQVSFYYLAMLRRSGEQGLTRKPSQTPKEYAVFLEQALPTVEEDIDAITEAFISARYSRQEVSKADANAVKAIWGRIRRALQVKSKEQ